MVRVKLSGCAIVKAGRLLLLFKKKRRHFEFPGGKVKPKESPEHAAKRETREEIGCEVTLVRYLGFIDFEIKKDSFRSHTFLAKIKKGVPHIAEPEKFAKLKWVFLDNREKAALAVNVRKFCRHVLENEISVN